MIGFKKVILGCLLVFLVSSTFGQSKKVWLKTADEYYQYEDYASALKYYLKILDDSTMLASEIIPYEVEISNQKLKNIDKELDSTRSVPVHDYIHHQVAMCYKRVNDYDMAVEKFSETSQFESYAEDLYYYAEALMSVKRYEEAIENFKTFIQRDVKTDSLTKFAQMNMTGSYFAMNKNSIRKGVKVTMMDSIFNGGTSAFAPKFWEGESKLLFTSAREGGVVFDPEKQESKFLCDIYYTEEIEDGVWGKAQNMGRPVNSGKHEAAACFNNSNVLFFTKWSDEDRNEQHIHLARMVAGKFFESFKLDESVNLPGYKSIQPFVSMDGSYLFFSSNRPGGIGGMDIWKVKIDNTGKPIAAPENLGRPINSESDEITPFFHEVTSTLFYSSNGLKSIGGFDVFKSNYDRKNELYSAPQNLGQPINSEMDDAYLIWDDLLNTGYFASDRDSCEGGHCYDIYKIDNAPIQVFLDGIVFDFDTDDVIPNANLTFKDVRYNFEPFEITTDEDGYYSLELERTWELFIKAQKPSYFADAASVDATVITQTTTITQDFYLQKIPEGEIEIDGIEYDFDSDKLRPESKVVLDKLFDFLEINDNLVVEINSHTDARGSDKYNLDLSRRRAKSCVDYLIEKGISEDRLSSNGYGETKPNVLKNEDKKVINDADGKPIMLTESYINAQPGNDRQNELHQKNRRTAFKVVGENFELDSD